jgi:hypothetical protein
LREIIDGPAMILSGEECKWDTMVTITNVVHRNLSKWYDWKLTIKVNSRFDIDCKRAEMLDWGV